MRHVMLGLVLATFTSVCMGAFGLAPRGVLGLFGVVAFGVPFINWWDSRKDHSAYAAYADKILEEVGRTCGLAPRK